MHYEGNIIRPPSEASSILLQVTVGCSRNKCAFCGAYQTERFKIKSQKIIKQDILFALNNFKYKSKLFLCDGDALIIPQKRLVYILKNIKEKLPWIKRVGAYANAKSLDLKTVSQLEELYSLGLKILYVGIETGDDDTLRFINKGVISYKLARLCHKIKMAGIVLSVTVLLGIGGRDRSKIHAKNTGKILSRIDPEYVGALTLMLIPGSIIYDKVQNGEFTLINPFEILQELRLMIEKTNLSKGLFHANHASNYLSIRAKIPEDKDKIIKKIDIALAGKVPLKSEWLRAL